MDQVVRWKGLITLIELHCPKGEGGSSGLSVDGDAARASVAELIRLQRSDHGEALYESTTYTLRRLANTINPNNAEKNNHAAAGSDTALRRLI